MLIFLISFCIIIFDHLIIADKCGSTCQHIANEYLFSSAQQPVVVTFFNKKIAVGQNTKRRSKYVDTFALFKKRCAVVSCPFLSHILRYVRPKDDTLAPFGPDPFQKPI
jgi:hypothetical protein